MHKTIGNFNDEVLAREIRIWLRRPPLRHRGYGAERKTHYRQRAVHGALFVRGGGLAAAGTHPVMCFPFTCGAAARRRRRHHGRQLPYADGAVLTVRDGAEGFL
jgi:hypothetical protein